MPVSCTAPPGWLLPSGARSSGPRSLDMAPPSYGSYFARLGLQEALGRQREERASLFKTARAAMVEELQKKNPAAAAQLAQQQGGGGGKRRGDLPPLRTP